MDINSKEKTIIDDLSYGYTSQQIADKNKWNMKTTETRRTRLLKKTGAKNSTELVAMAFRAGVISCLLLLVGCSHTTKYSKNPDTPIFSETLYEGDLLRTIQHDGCLFVICTQGGIIHHPKCTNHETTFR